MTEPGPTSDERGGAPDGPAFELDAPLAALGGDLELLREATRDFFADLPLRVGDLHAGALAEDPRELLRAVHTARGVAAQVGAVAVTRAAAALEEALRAGEARAQAGGLLERLLDALAGAPEGAMQAWAALGGLGSAGREPDRDLAVTPVPGGAVERVLVAEDDPTTRRLLQGQLERWGFSVVAVADGKAAEDVLLGADPPQLALLDWMMPGLDGVELVRRVRRARPEGGLYLVILTGRTDSGDVAEALEAGADDHMPKPYDLGALRARLRVGRRTLALQARLRERVEALEVALARVRRLEGLLSICSYCRKVRDRGDAWRALERYVQEHSDARFSHGVCPDCRAALIRDDPNWAAAFGRPGHTDPPPADPMGDTTLG